MIPATSPSHPREFRGGGARRTLGRVLMAGCLLATSAVPAAAQATGHAAEIKRITDRYALTRARISALLDMRLQPVALPANPPNPFYQSPPDAVADTASTGQEPSDTAVPEAADISDIDTLRKYAASLKIGGIITRNDVPHLTINNTASKVGDIITVGPKDHPIYLKLVALNSAQFTLGLNDATLAVSLRR